MNYVLKPSLEHIALVKIVSTLWNHCHVRAVISKFNFSIIGDKRYQEWKKMEEEVADKVSQLLQPAPLKKKILGFIKPIGLEILSWMECHLEDYTLCSKLPDRFIWTPQGTIDKKKTAQILIKDEYLDIIKRYKLACIYCLENDVLEMWKKIPENCREALYNTDFSRQQDLVFLWTFDIRRDLGMMDIFNQEKLQRKYPAYRYAFEYAAEGGNKAAVEYFLGKLTSEYREESLVKTAGIVAKRRCALYRKNSDFSKIYYTDILCLLLSKMDNEQQVEVLKSYPFEVLQCFLDFPWPRFFIKTANRMWDYFPKQHHGRLLRVIVSKVIDGYKDFYYLNLFWEFLKQSPNAFKSYFIDERSWVHVLSQLLKVKDIKNIKLIFQEVTIIAKKKFIFSFSGYNICLQLISDDEWDLLELILGECISSKDEMTKLMEEFKKPNVWWCPNDEFFIHKEKLAKFFWLFDDYKGVMIENV